MRADYVRSVYLHGSLGDRFGREHRLAVQSPAEAVSALHYLKPGFTQALLAGSWRVVRGDPETGMAFEAGQLNFRVGDAPIHFLPVIHGQAKGLGKVIAGVALAIGGFLIGGPAGSALAWATRAAQGIGISMALQGASQLLTKSPSSSDKTSFLFSSVDNSVSQGDCVPVIIGEFRTPGLPVSTGLTTEQLSSAGSKSQRSNATLKVVDLIGEGECVGLVGGAQGIYFDGTRLEEPSTGLRNFPNVVFETRVGLPDQDPLGGFPDIESTASVNTKVLQATPVVSTVSDLDADDCRVTVQLPTLYKSGDSGVKRLTVEVKIEVKSNAGSYIQFVDDTISAANTAPLEKSYLIQNLPALGTGPWSVRVTRVTDDYTDSKHFGDLFFEYLTTIINHRLIYPDSAIIGISADAQSFGGNSPVRTYQWQGVKMEVPSNYDPETRVYTGTWDGTFTVAYAKNPAWVFWMFATQNRFGLGGFIAATGINKWALYAIAQYADQLVDDGKGGLEPRYECNGRISEREEAYRFMLAIASIFRGMIYFTNGEIVPVADMPDTPIKLLTPANVVDGRFTYQGSGLDGRHTIAQVSWNNPDLAYNVDVEICTDSDGVYLLGDRVSQTVAPLCTSRGQAHRWGEWLLDTEKNQGDSVAYTCSWDQLGVFPGSLVYIDDPAITSLRAGGRLLGAADARTVTLDAPFFLDPATDYMIHVIMPDGSRESREVTNAGGFAVDVITVAPDFPDVPLANAVWIISTALGPRQFKVISIMRSSQGAGLYDVNALLYDPSKYARVESGFSLDSPNLTPLPTGELGHPADIAIQEYLYDAGAGTILGGIAFGWKPTTDARVDHYDVETLRGESDWAPAGTTVDPSLQVTDFTSDETAVSIRVRSVDVFGHYSSWVAAAFAVTMFIDPPADVTGFSANAAGDQANFTWDTVTSLGFSHYVIRYSPLLTGATWGTAQILASGINGAPISLPVQIGSYLIKAVSLAGVESVNATTIVSSAAGLTQYNPVASVVGEPSWTGTKTHATVVGTTLELDASQPSGTIVFAAVDLGAVYSARVTASLKAHGDNSSYVMNQWIPLSSVETLSAADPSGWNVLVEERHTPDNPAGSPTWTPYAPVQVGTISARGHQIRLTLQSLATGIRAVVDNFLYAIDMPDRHIIDKNLQSTTSGVTVTFAAAFLGIKTVLVSIVDPAAGDYYKIASMSATAFHVDVYNSSNAKVDRKINYDAIGYGIAA